MDYSNVKTITLESTKTKSLTLQIKIWYQVVLIVTLAKCISEQLKCGQSELTYAVTMKHTLDFKDLTQKVRM